MRSGHLLFALLPVVLCGACKRNATIATVDGPVKAELVASDGAQISVPAGGGRGALGAPELHEVRGTAVIVHGAKKTHSVQVSDDRWSEGQLVEDDKGERLAYHGGPSWRWIHITADGLAWKGVGELASPAIDWARVGTLEAEAPKMFESVTSTEQSAFLAELTKRGGEAAAVSFLLATVDLRVDTGHGEGPWLSLARGLPPARKAEVDKALRPRIVDQSVPLDRLERVVDVVDAGDAALAEPIAARLRALPLKAPQANERVAAVLMRGLTRGNKALAADVGCAILGRVIDADGMVAQRDTAQHLASARQHLAEAALVAVAHARARCAVTEPLYAKHPCDESLRCGEVADDAAPAEGGAKDPLPLPMCQKEELLKEVDEGAAKADGRDDHPLVLHLAAQFPRLALAVALGTSPAAPAVARANLRRTYAVSGATWACPARLVREDACRLDTARSDSLDGTCPFVVDDRTRRITLKASGDR